MEPAPSNESSELQVTKRSHRSLIAAAASFVLISIALYTTPDNLEHWHFILQRLFFFPIIVAGVAFGWKGGGLVALISSAAYLLRHDDLDRLDTIDHTLDAAMFCLIGVLTGILSQREQQGRENLRQSALRLEEVYRELQRNVEHLKRSARMSALGQLSASLAHEIRNPLASIEGAAFVAQSEPDDTRKSEFLEIILKETKRLNGLVSHFLEFARPRAPQRAAENAHSLCQSVFTLIARVAAENRVEIENGVPAMTPEVDCDSEQMRQVLLNLFLNAIQAMPAGGRLTVTAAPSQTDLMIRIHDTGPGIPPEYADEVFDPFFSTKQHGTGLGLPIAYTIVQQHGGELILESTSPKGSCFAIRLPLANTTVQSVAAERPVA